MTSLIVSAFARLIAWQTRRHVEVIHALRQLQERSDRIEDRIAGAEETQADIKKQLGRIESKFSTLEIQP